MFLNQAKHLLKGNQITRGENFLDVIYAEGTAELDFFGTLGVKSNKPYISNSDAYYSEEETSDFEPVFTEKGEGSVYVVTDCVWVECDTELSLFPLDEDYYLVGIGSGGFYIRNAGEEGEPDSYYYLTSYGDIFTWEGIPPREAFKIDLKMYHEHSVLTSFNLAKAPRLTRERYTQNIMVSYNITVDSRSRCVTVKGAGWQSMVGDAMTFNRWEEPIPDVYSIDDEFETPIDCTEYVDEESAEYIEGEYEDYADYALA